MLLGTDESNVCEQIKACGSVSGKTKADWISWAAIVLNLAFTVAAFWWAQRKEALQKYRCVHFLAVEFDHVMHMMDSTVEQCERVLDMLFERGVPLTTTACGNVFQQGTGQSHAAMHDDVQLKSAIQVRSLRVRALSEGARRLKDEADMLCKITRSSDERRQVQRLIECLASITHLELTFSQEDPSYLSRLVTRDLAADLLRSGRRVLAICCRRLQSRPSTCGSLNFRKLFMRSDQRQALEIWEKYSASESKAPRGVATGCPKPCRRECSVQGLHQAIKAFDASIPSLPEAGEAEMTVFDNPTSINEATVAELREIRDRVADDVPAFQQQVHQDQFHCSL